LITYLQTIQYSMNNNYKMTSDNTISPPDTFNLDLYFELSPDLLCIAGYDGYFKKINQTVSKTLGYSKSELLSRPIHTFIHPDDRVETARARQNVVNNIPLINFENRYLTKDGETVWLSWTSMPIQSEEIVFAIAKIVSHRRVIEEDRNQLLNTLTKVNKDLKQLTYTASHDLRAPVNNLLSVFNVMDLSRIQDEETLEFVNILKTATKNLEKTLDNYLDILSNEEALRADRNEDIYFQDCLDNVLLSLGSLLQVSNVIIHSDFTALPNIKGNKISLDSVFLNLITNSIKYAKPDGHPEIFISSKHENEIKQLLFEDKGVGFDMDKVKNKIFGFGEKFDHHPGNKGIGLYLVQNHITSLGGSIAVESKVNEGAKFIITF
jgi:PAS domain S-box-containing protein